MSSIAEQTFREDQRQVRSVWQKDCTAWPRFKIFIWKRNKNQRSSPRSFGQYPEIQERNWWWVREGLNINLQQEEFVNCLYKDMPIITLHSIAVTLYLYRRKIRRLISHRLIKNIRRLKILSRARNFVTFSRWKFWLDAYISSAFLFNFTFSYQLRPGIDTFTLVYYI